MLFLWTYTQNPLFGDILSLPPPVFKISGLGGRNQCPIPQDLYRFSFKGVLPQVREEFQGIQRFVHTTNAKLQEATARIPQAVRRDLQQSFREMEIRLLGSLSG